MTQRRSCERVAWLLPGAPPSGETLSWRLLATGGELPEGLCAAGPCSAACPRPAGIETRMHSWGHNELEAPEVTLPLTYAAIREHPPLSRLYAERLQAGGIVTAEEVADMQVSRCACAGAVQKRRAQQACHHACGPPSQWQALLQWRACRHAPLVPSGMRHAAPAIQEAMEAQHADDHARFEAGEFSQTLQEWLQSSWQGDALQARTPAADTIASISSCMPCMADLVGGASSRKGLQPGSAEPLLPGRVTTRICSSHGPRCGRPALSVAAWPQALQGPARQLHHQERSGLPLRTLQWVGQELCRTPPGFHLHPSVAALIHRRRCAKPSARVQAAAHASAARHVRGVPGAPPVCRDMVERPDSRVDYAFAEALAFGTLALHRGFQPPVRGGGQGPQLSADHPQVPHAACRAARGSGSTVLESGAGRLPWHVAVQALPHAADQVPGPFCASVLCPCLLPAASQEGLNYGAYSVRLSGQDSERGTFNQRHACYHDQVTGQRCALPACLPRQCQAVAPARQSPWG